MTCSLPFARHTLTMSGVLVPSASRKDIMAKGETNINDSDIGERIYDSLPCGVAHFAVSDGGVSILDVNAACWKICGYPSKDAFIEVVRDQADAVIHPEDRERFARLAAQVTRTGKRVDDDLRILKCDGSIGHVHKTLELITNVSGEQVLQDTFMDTTERMARLEAEQGRNARTQEMLHQALKNSNVYFWEYDLDSLVCTNGFKSIEELGLPATMEDYPECVIRSGVVLPEFAEGYRAMHRRMREGDFSNASIDIKASFGQPSWRHIVYVPLPNDEQGHRKAFGISTPLDDYVITSAMGESLVANGFDYLALGDLTTNVLTIYLDSITGIRSNRVVLDYGTQHLTDYVRSFVVEEDQAEQLEWLQPANIARMSPDDRAIKMYCRMYDSTGEIRSKRVIVQRTNRYGGSFIITRTDITEAVEKERQDNERLRDALEEARKANNARGDFLSHMSHEMRTPLNGVIGSLDLMEKASPDEIETYRAMAVLSARHLANILNDILDMAKIDSGTMSLSATHVDMREVVKFLRGVITPMAVERDIDFRVHVRGNAGPSAYLDEGRLRQILLNLLSNAVKYTEPGGTVLLELVGNKVDDNLVRATFTVSDTGVGMSREFLAHAFEPFTQEKDSNSKVGTGLGLPITKSLVELMGGTLEATSDEGNGSRFRFTLTFPSYDPARKPDAEGQDLIGEACRLGDCRGKRALVVDDNPVNLIIATKLFQSFGLLVDSASSGEEAVDLFSASDVGHFDIIFMDVMMPGIDGYEATALIRGSGRADATVPIVAMTANAFAQDAEQSKRAGMTAHLPKPFQRNEVAEVINQLL